MNNCRTFSVSVRDLEGTPDLVVTDRGAPNVPPALIDRLLHHCHIVNIRGNSYRMRAHQDLLRPARSDDDVRSGAA